ncbi:hypothetical protein [Homoserinimonas hongtaonis]|uniref:hypothetical protein n=1 Tax=Homoserinimonas hongtaonis TaxID=2079791 RepID=UPI000D3CB643|nr:hypothetical protein [Salinibacterium hongtaonis]AWB90309.1 hypothetical protein C2138_12795 [Salinibacterium hongtaonis]
MSKKTIITLVSALAALALIAGGIFAAVQLNTETPEAKPAATAPAKTEAPVEPVAPATPREEAVANSGLAPERYAEVAADFANYGIEGIPASGADDGNRTRAISLGSSLRPLSITASFRGNPRSDTVLP